MNYIKIYLAFKLPDAALSNYGFSLLNFI